MTDHCKFCGDPITWAVTEKGKNAPVQADAQGTLILLPVEKGRMYPRATTVPLAGEGGIEIRTLRYVLHLPICTKRRKRERGARHGEVV